MNTSRTLILCSMVLAFALVEAGTASAQQAKHRLSEQQSLDLLIRTIRQDSLYIRWTGLECLRFLTEKRAAGYFDIAVREKHGNGCPGDPATEPVVDRFRVMRATGKMLWYDVVEDAYIAYDRDRVRRNP